MARVRGELVVGGKFVDHGRHQRVGKLEGAAAAPADRVMMSAVSAEGVLHRARAQVGLDEQVQLAQEIEGAVDRGQVDVTVDPLHRSVHILRSDVAGDLLDHIQNDRALRRDAHPAPLDFLNKIAWCHGLQVSSKVVRMMGGFGFAIANELRNLR